MAVFFNVLDLACIVTHIVYQKVTKCKHSRRQFLLELINDL